MIDDIQLHSIAHTHTHTHTHTYVCMLLTLG